MQPQLLTVIDKEDLKKWTPSEWRRWWIEPKRDGFRAIFRNGKFFSRTNKPLYNLEHIEAELKGLKHFVLDGEIHGNSWNETSSVARASKTKKKSNLKFYVFDLVSASEWQQQSCPWPLRERRLDLHCLFAGMEHVYKYVELAVHQEGYSYEIFELLHQHNLDNGCDGTVLKLADSLYEFKRTKTWLKVKPVETYDGKIVGIEEGTGKYKGMVGSLIVDFDGVETNVSGMSDAQRKEWWKPTSHMAGKIIEVSARGKHPSGKLIEPRFERIREDKNI